MGLTKTQALERMEILFEERRFIDEHGDPLPGAIMASQLLHFPEYEEVFHGLVVGTISPEAFVERVGRMATQIEAVCIRRHIEARLRGVRSA